MTMEQANQRIKDAFVHDLTRSKNIPDDIGKIFTGWVRNRTNEALANAKANSSAGGAAQSGGGNEAEATGGEQPPAQEA